MTSIQTIIDRTGANEQVLPAATFLASLSDVAIVELRRTITSGRAEGRPTHLCGKCREPIYLAMNPSRDGKPGGMHFAHYANGGTPCEWRSGSKAGDPRAAQYDGQQEGERHQQYKADLADMLDADGRFTDVKVEKRTTGDTSTWRQPDVSAMFEGRRVAFDIQLATLSPADIVAREEFYRAEGIHYVWVADAERLPDLSQQAFRDICLASGGRLFAISTRAVVASMETGLLQLEELSLEPRIDPPKAIYNRWDREIVGAEIIMTDPAARRREGMDEYGRDLWIAADQRFSQELTKLRASAAKIAAPPAADYDKVAMVVGSAGYHRAITDGIAPVLSLLRQIELAGKATGTDRSAAHARVRERIKVVLEHKHTAGMWSPLLARLVHMYPLVATAMTPAMNERLAVLRRSWAGNPGTRYHRRMLAVLFPWLAFYLLASPPKYGPRNGNGAPRLLGRTPRPVA